MQNDDWSLSRLAARAEIQEVMHRWCRAVDRCDWAAVPEVFHPDGHDNHGLYEGGIEGLVAWLSERHETIARSMHLVGNMLIEFADDDNALAETYCLTLQRYSSNGAETRKAIAGGIDVGDQPFDMLSTGRYVDHFQRRQGRWKILERTVVFDNSRMLPVPEGGAQMGAGWAVSTRGFDDPIWGIRSRLGLAR